ncbi:MAG: EamA family transporter [Blastocatellia bacterium]|nr:EamA family transporter [Blastocatellia bacterium]
MKLLPLLLLAILTNSIGNALLSHGMKTVSPVLEACLATGNYPGMVLPVLTNPSFLGGLTCLVTFFLLFLTLLSKADLSYVLPVTSFNYVITVAIAAFMLKEQVSPVRWLAVLIISMGVLLVARGESRTVTDTEDLPVSVELAEEQI